MLPQDDGIIYEISDVDWTHHYAEIGRFIVEFEKISHDLRFNYACLMQLDGLIHIELAHALLNVPSIGPEMLAICYSAAAHVLSTDKEALIWASDIVKRVKSLAELRNQVVHGRWIIGPEVIIVSDTAELPKNPGIRRKTTKSGNTFSNVPNIEEIGNHIEDCIIVRNLIKEIFSSILQQKYRNSTKSQ